MRCSVQEGRLEPQLCYVKYAACTDQVDITSIVRTSYGLSRRLVSYPFANVSRYSLILSGQSVAK